MGIDYLEEMHKWLKRQHIIGIEICEERGGRDAKDYLKGVVWGITIALNQCEVFLENRRKND